MRDMRDENRYGWRDDEREFEQGEYGQGRYGPGQGYGQGGYGQGYKGDYGQGDYGRGQGRLGPRRFDQPSSQGYQSGGRGYGQPGSRGTDWRRGGEWHGRDWQSGESENLGQAEHATSYSGLTNDWDEQRGRFAGRGPKGYRRSDERIREDVNDRLTDDSWLDASDIEVKAEKGMVTLTGSVGSRDDKRRAEDIVMSISGVKDVINQIHVDQGILEQMSDALTGGDSKREKATTSSKR